MHTIEGNTSDAVMRRSYPLSYHTITGYGVISDYITSSGKTSKGKKSGKNTGKSSGKQEISYLREILKKNESKKKKSTRKVEYKAVSVKNSEKLVVNVLIKHGKKRYKHQVQEGLKQPLREKMHG